MYSRHLSTCLGLLAALGSLFAACTSAPLPQINLTSVPAPHQAIQPTVVHILLADELRYRFTCPQKDGTEWYATALTTLNELLDKAGKALRSMGTANWNEANQLVAEQGLGAVDRVLAESGYVVCIKTNLLSTTLGQPIPLPSSSDSHMSVEEKPCILVRQPSYRDAAIQAHWREGLRPLDCDLGALLYLAVAQRNGLPLTFVAVPDHNFVRWHLPDGSYFNWDNNDAAAYNDDDYRQAKPRTVGTTFGPDEEKLNGYLLDMSLDEIRTYYDGLIIGKIPVGFGKCVEELYSQIRTNLASDATAQNNFAWAFSTRPEFSGTTYGLRAVELAERATTMQPEDCNFWDTLSCAYAAVGRFADAVRIERDHTSPTSPRIKRFLQEETCFDPSVAKNGGC
jgi:hypothetical protein